MSPLKVLKYGKTRFFLHCIQIIEYWNMFQKPKDNLKPCFINGARSILKLVANYINPSLKNYHYNSNNPKMITPIPKSPAIRIPPWE